MSLIGHNAPVTLLKLDPLGKVLLSGDTEGRDKSIRVWDLSSGEGANFSFNPINLKIKFFYKENFMF